MSGGVDSSVAAARLMKQGHEVIGVTLHLWDYPDDSAPKSRCCAPEDIHDAGRVAAHLGFPHYAFDRREAFLQRVVQPFVQDYLDATTPSPCVHCNRLVKFAELFGIAERLGCSALATGHYANIEQVNGRHELHRGVDLTKDQSYFLFSLLPQQLAKLCFPLGNGTKAEVRAEALELGLPGATKGESQELCFVQTGEYDQFIASQAPERVRPGNIVDRDGRVLGSHQGVHQFTLGQRKNLGVATGQRSYVTTIDAASGDVHLGEKSDLERDWARLDEVYLSPDISLPLDVLCMVRYRGELHPVTVHEHHAGIYAEFAAPTAPVVPGQFAVFFQANRVLGGGKIAAAGRKPLP
jgi:tRNA-specific 2-thiouridylase